MFVRRPVLEHIDISIKKKPEHEIIKWPIIDWRKAYTIFQHMIAILRMFIQSLNQSSVYLKSDWNYSAFFFCERLALWVKFSADEIWKYFSYNEICKYFSYFSQKTGFDISCKMSQFSFFLENRIWSFILNFLLSILFSGKIQKKKKKIYIYIYINLSSAELAQSKC